ncbi:MAG: hypothetical protein C0622_13220 [Desulfuromonas sp.]|nr:MAG: hypothetical protein C0622_13220 [Desulfuromonas sp.]
MKCPKCGYTSFDYLDTCKKCGKDLAEFKERFGIRSILFPNKPQGNEAPAVSEGVMEAAATVAAETAAEEVSVETPAAADQNAPVVAPMAPQEAAGDDFGFDFMGEEGEEEDLSFDELFEEMPENEEERSAEPKSESSEIKPTADDFSFDVPEGDDDLDDDFGFGSDDEPDDKGDKGSGEASPSPFELPELSPDEGAPVADQGFADATAASAGPAAVTQDEYLSEPLQDAFWTDEDESIPEEESFVFEDEQPTVVDVAPSASPTVEPATGAVPVHGSLAAAAALDDAETPAAEDPFAEEEIGFSEGVEESAYDQTPVDAAAVAVPSFGGRIVAFLCDVVLLALVGACFIIAAELAMTGKGDHWLPSLETLIDLSIPYFLVMFFLAFGYFTLFHFLAGQTLGKMLLGLQVETVSGAPMSFSHAFLRSVGGLLQILPIGLGYLTILASKERRGWNDKIAGTRLIRLRKQVVNDQ